MKLREITIALLNLPQKPLKRAPRERKEGRLRLSAFERKNDTSF